MKKIFGSLFVCMIFLYSCPIGNLPSDPPKSDSAQYRHFDYLYSGGTGQAYNSQYLSGEIYDRYPAEVQGRVNSLLLFPVPESVSTPYVGSWWNSVPSSIASYATDNDYAALSAALDPFFKSETGSEMIRTLLDQSFNDLANIDAKIDEADAVIRNDGLNATVAVNIATAGFEAILDLGEAICSSASPLSMAIKIFGIAAGMTDIASDNSIMNRINALGDKIMEIDAKLDRMQEDLSALKNYVLAAQAAALYANVQGARDMLAIKKTELNNLLAIAPEEISQRVSDFLLGFSGETSFETMHYNANTYGKNTQICRIENNLIRKIDTRYAIKEYHAQLIPFGVGYNVQMLERVLVSEVPLQMERPDYFIKTFSSPGNISFGMAASDIFFMVDLGRFRMDIAGMAFSGTKLLEFKGLAAANELNDFLPINQALDNGPVNLDAGITGVCAQLQEPAWTNTTQDGWCDIYVVVDYATDEIVLTLSHFYDKGFQDDLLLDLYYTQPNTISASSWAEDYIYTGDVNVARAFLAQKMKERYYEDFGAKEYFIRLKSIVASWMITLQSHVDAMR